MASYDIAMPHTMDTDTSAPPNYVTDSSANAAKATTRKAVEPRKTSMGSSARGLESLRSFRWGPGLRATDGDGKSNPYVVARIGELAKRKSRTVKSTLKPEFDEMLDFDGQLGELLASPLHLKVKSVSDVHGMVVKGDVATSSQVSNPIRGIKPAPAC